MAAQAAAVDSVTLRFGRRTDMPAVAWIEMRSFSWERLLAGVWQRVGERNTRTWIAEHKGRVVGYMFTHERELDGTVRHYMSSAGVLPHLRSLGIGRRIFEATMAHYGSCWMHVRATNPAIKLYERLGFAILRKLPGFYRNGDDAVIMVWPLDAFQPATGPNTQTATRAPAVSA
jgi:[ribosomal protein S18]-alanine N-acetyltransferase